MPDETKIIQPSYGPFAGQQITVPAAEADEAISAGWAVDPYAPPSTEQPAAADLDPDARQALIDAADAAARKWRGEEESEDVKKAKAKTKDDTSAKPASRASEETRDMKAGGSADYQTRESQPAQPASTSKRRR